MPMIDIYATEGERHGGKTHGRAFVASRVISIGPARIARAIFTGYSNSSLELVLDPGGGRAMAALLCWP